jgi:glutathione S-transferase
VFFLETRKSTMKLYHHPLSGHSHRARLFLSLLGVPHDLVEVDLAKGAHKSPDYLRINPFGQVPALDDEGTIVTDSNAIMVYLARKLGKTEWLPNSPLAEARIQKWLSVAAGQIAYGPAAARLITVFGSDFRPEEVIQRAHGVLALIEVQLSSQAFIAAEQPTIADIALYSYVARAPEGNVDLSDYPQVRGWLARIEALPGFVDFRRTPVGLGA